MSSKSNRWDNKRSKSNRWDNKISKFVSVPEANKKRRVKQPTRDWLELPSDLMVNIFQRVGVIDILENAQKVCTAWRKISKDPAVWRVIYMDIYSDSEIYGEDEHEEMFKHAVDRSQGQLVDLTLADLYCCSILQYVADRSSQLRRLEIKNIDLTSRRLGIWSEALKKLSLLEELSLGNPQLTTEDIVTAGRYCPLLKTLKIKLDDPNESLCEVDEGVALAIGKNLHALTHLELNEIIVDNIALQAILDGCCHLESLDLSHALGGELKEDLKKRCSQQIKHLKLPEDRPKQSIFDVLAWDDICDDPDQWRILKEKYERGELKNFW